MQKRTYPPAVLYLLRIVRKSQLPNRTQLIVDLHLRLDFRRHQVNDYFQLEQQHTHVNSYLGQTITSASYHLLDSNTECRLIVRCGKTVTEYHVSKLFDLVPHMEECSALNFNTFNERRKFHWRLFSVQEC